VISTVDVWSASLALHKRELVEMAASLSPDEAERARTFVRPRDAFRFIAGRGLLRNILALYTDRSTSDLRFGCEEGGKPRLEGAVDDLRFSVSHSGPVLVCAISMHADVGVDIEHVRDGLWTRSLAHAVFTDDELHQIGPLRHEDATHRLFRAWTRKEAYLKGIGQGLRVPVRDVSIVRAGADPGFRVERAGVADVDWTLQDFSPATGYVASAAVAASAWTLRQCMWVGGPWIPAFEPEDGPLIEVGGYR
jgi:4'-phosphopantetheinyl transferase